MKWRTIVPIPAVLLLFQVAAFAVTVRDVQFDSASIGRVVFSHREHMSRKEMARNCRACHDSIFDLKKRTRYMMSDMKKGKSCGACHDGRKAFGVDRCMVCHPVTDVAYKVKETGVTSFSHKSHVAAASCGTCHPKLYAPNRKNKRVGMAGMDKGRSCGACHNGKQAFSVKECTKCHHVKELLFKEQSVGNVVFSHTNHIAAFTCADCHDSLYAAARSRVTVTMKEMETGKSCGMCHDGITAFGVKEKCELCHTM